MVVAVIVDGCVHIAAPSFTGTFESVERRARGFGAGGELVGRRSMMVRNATYRWCPVRPVSSAVSHNLDLSASIATRCSCSSQIRPVPGIRMFSCRSRYPAEVWVALYLRLKRFLI